MPEASDWGSLPALLCTDEVAGLLHLNPKTVLAMVRDGRLPAHRLPGTRKFQFLTAEVMASLADVQEGNSAMTAIARSLRLPDDVDPCDVWGAAPAPRAGGDWRADCLAHWIELAQVAGLSVEVVNPDAAASHRDRRWTGRVRIDGLVYDVLTGPRQRAQVIDDEGELRWTLVDAVWVEPAVIFTAGASRQPPLETTPGARRIRPAGTWPHTELATVKGQPGPTAPSCATGTDDL